MNELERISISLSSLGILDDNPKSTQLEDDRFNRMKHFYDADEIDPETLEDFDLGDDGKVNRTKSIDERQHRKEKRFVAG
jgi:hypothetical protein